MPVVNRILRRSAREWFQTGSQSWATVAILSGGWLIWRRVSRRTEQVVHREVLRPGTTLIVSGIREAATSTGEVAARS